MIENSNPISIEFDDYDSDDIAIGASCADGEVSMSEVIAGLKKRRDNILSGGINCIPLPFERFRSEIPGIEQENYVLLTASMKAGKTMLTSFLYLYHVLDYAFNHRKQCTVHIIYFNLEESQSRIKQRYISHLLFKLDGIRISPSDLRSTSADFPLDDKILSLLETKRYKERLDFFDKTIKFESEDTNPTGILRVCEEYAKSVGKYESYQRSSRADSNRKVDVFKSYTPNDQNHYKIVLIDHIGLIDLERGMSLKQSMDKLSEYAVKYLRNRYKYTVVFVQQQAMESEGLDAIKQKKMVPAVATLGDTKYTARDANVVLGLFDPSFFGLQNWLGYKIDMNGEGLQNYARFLYFIRGRDGEQGGICPLFFDGATCTFEELPLPSDTNAVAKYYERARKYKDDRRKRRSTIMSLLLFIKNIKHKL